MASLIPVSTHSYESSVIQAPSDEIWGIISNLNFQWWQLVNQVSREEGQVSNHVGSLLTIHFKDGVAWTVQIVEFSNLKKSVTFEVISSEPALQVTSVIHTISVTKVTSNNSTFIEWISDFSNDATAEVVADSSYKRLDAFANLASFVAK